MLTNWTATDTLRQTSPNTPRETHNGRGIQVTGEYLSYVQSTSAYARMRVDFRHTPQCHNNPPASPQSPPLWEHLPPLIPRRGHTRSDSQSNGVLLLCKTTKQPSVFKLIYDFWLWLWFVWTPPPLPPPSFLHRDDLVSHRRSSLSIQIRCVMISPSFRGDHPRE